MLLLMLTFIIQFNLDFSNTGFFEPPIFRTILSVPWVFGKSRLSCTCFCFQHLHTTFCSNMFKLYEKNHNFYADTLPKKLNNLISHGGNFLQKISRLQLKLSNVSYKSIFPLQTEFIRWVIKFPKVWDRFGQFSISINWDIRIFVEFGPNHDVTATKTGVV